MTQRNPARHRLARAAAFAAVLAGLTLAAPLAAHDHEGAPAEFKADPGRDGIAYPVSGIKLEVVSSEPSHPTLMALPEHRVTLGQVDDGYVAPHEGVPQAEVTLLVAPYTNYYASALRAIGTQLADYLTEEGFESVFVYPVEEQIDPETGRDLRALGQVTLRMLVRAEPRKNRGWFR